MNNESKKIRVPYGLSVHGKEEAKAVFDVVNEHRTAMGRETKAFENKIAELFGKKYGVMVNSGSSANLLALEILNLPPGSEIITPALTFNTTLSPIIQKGFVPVFVDVEHGTYLIDINKTEAAITKKTRALMIPSLIGNIPNMARLQKIAKKHSLYFIEDSCDTLGGTFNGKPTGFYSDISTTSFYGSHVINGAGGGGMISINNPVWRDQLMVLRGWGRTSSLFADSENMEERFVTKLNDVHYDGKFIFTEFGYNFLPMEISAAFGLVQLKKFPKFSALRNNNFQKLFHFFAGYPEFFELPVTNSQVKTNWLAFPLSIKKHSPFSRFELVTHLEKNNIQTRPIFTGNILSQPIFNSAKFKNMDYKSISSLIYGKQVRSAVKRNKQNAYPVADQVMTHSFVVGCHQGLNLKHLNYLKRTFQNFLESYK